MVMSAVINGDGSRHADPDKSRTEGLGHVRAVAPRPCLVCFFGYYILYNMTSTIIFSYTKSDNAF